LECLNFGYKDDTFCRRNFSLSFFFFLFFFFFHFFLKKLKIQKPACDESCLKCSGPLSTDCMACPGSKYLLNGECLDDCPFGYFTSGSQCQSLIFFLLLVEDSSIIND